jgi:hypothetical protein
VPAQGRWDALWFVNHLTPREPNHLPTLKSEREISVPISVEGDPVTMHRLTVGLDHELVVRPMEVHSQEADLPIDDRVGQSGGPDELQEAALELAVDRQWLVGQVGKDAPQHPCSAPAARTLENGIEGDAVEDVELERTFEGAAKLAFVLRHRG